MYKASCLKNSDFSLYIFICSIASSIILFNSCFAPSNPYYDTYVHLPNSLSFPTGFPVISGFPSSDKISSLI